MDIFTLMVIAYFVTPLLGFLVLGFLVSEPDLRTPKMKKMANEKHEVDKMIAKQARIND